MLKIKSAAGPASYATATPPTIDFGEFERVVSVLAKCDRDEILGVADTVYAIRVSIAGNVVTYRVFVASTVGAGPNAWAEIADGSDLSGRTFTVIAEGE